MSILDRVPAIKEHIELYRTDPVRAHHWKLPGWETPLPTLLLTTRGHSSGEPRDVVLIYGKAAGSFVVIASLGGAPDHPSWYKNLKSDPSAEIQVGPDHYRVKARDAQGSERAGLWTMMAEIFPTYDEYAQRTAGIREIPVVVLDPE